MHRVIKQPPVAADERRTNLFGLARVNFLCFFRSATYYWEAHPEKAARRIAAMGGVAWQHQNGLWVFSKLEKNNKVILTCDTKPKNAIKILGPELLLQWNGYGFVWRTYKYK